MGTTSFTSCCSSLTYHQQQIIPHHHRTKASAIRENRGVDEESGNLSGFLKRRQALLSGFSLVSSAVFGFPGEGSAVVKQGPLAGRIPGLSEPDEQGWRTYRRPDEKSGGHGVGWSPIIPYVFSVPQDWQEVPVSIADLGGTEIDLRFASSKEGRLFVIVAPVLRFADNLGNNATIERIGSPDKVINAFGPEVIGENVEGKVISMEVSEHSGRKYYQYELEPPHALITATAAGNRLYLFNVTASGMHFFSCSHQIHVTNAVNAEAISAISFFLVKWWHRGSVHLSTTRPSSSFELSPFLEKLHKYLTATHNGNHFWPWNLGQNLCQKC